MPTSAFNFLVHPGRESWQVVDQFLREFRTSQPRARLGATVWLPRTKPASTLERSGSYDQSADYVIADPEPMRCELPFSRRGRARDELPYLQESDAAANRPRFVKQVLKAQVDNGRDVLVSPWLLHGISGTNHELDVTVDFAKRAAAHQLAQGRKLLLGFGVTDDIIAHDQARDEFLNEIVELDGNHPIYLRMRISAPPGRKQYERQDALAGLRKAVDSLSKNDCPVVLPQSGLAGWLMLPFGAKAFGAGIDASMQRNLPASSGGGGVPPLNWYFLPQFLGFVLAEELSGLQRVQGFQQCPCPYCDPPIQGGARFDSRRAGLHFLWWCATLAAELNQDRQPAARIRKRIADAQSFATSAQQAQVRLDRRSQPTHLEAWTAVVQQRTSPAAGRVPARR